MNRVNESDVVIKDLIYNIRGKWVMLDSDIAKLYGYLNGARVINQNVKRNLNKFNSNLYFQLTNEEFSNLISQRVISSLGNYGGIRKMPYVFTKEGIIVLNDILKKGKITEIKKKVIQEFDNLDSIKLYENSLQTSINKGFSLNELIYNVRGKLVMLDEDLAKIYQCVNGTKDINKAVKRNLERFPDDFYFQLTEDEFSNLRFQFGTSSLKEYGGRRYLPYAFTEHGVIMLSSLLNSSIAVEVNKRIVRAFVSMRNIINTSLLEQKFINNMVLEHDSEIKLLQESFDKLSSKEVNNHIFYEGQIYDAYSLLIDILSESKEDIIIIDNYAGKELFDIIKDIDKDIAIVSKNIDEVMLAKYKSQYKNINIINSNKFHDRFIIIDKKILYHSGASFKDLGKKCFAINKIIDKDILNKLLMELKLISL